MRRILETIALLAQTLFYTAGVMVLIYLILWGTASNERMQASSERMQHEHERIMLLLDETLRERARR